jgi:hypothetical protein
MFLSLIVPRYSSLDSATPNFLQLIKLKVHDSILVFFFSSRSRWTPGSSITPLALPDIYIGTRQQIVRIRISGKISSGYLTSH